MWYKIEPLCIKLPKMSGYAKRFAETKCMPFLIKDGQLLKKCTEI